MIPATLEALAVVLVAVVPGYIAVTLWARSKTWERPPTDLTLVLLAIMLSADHPGAPLPDHHSMALAPAGSVVRQQTLGVIGLKILGQLSP